MWSSLPSDVWHTDSIQQFKSALKAHLFGNSIHGTNTNFADLNVNHYVWSTSTCVSLHDWENLACDNFYLYIVLLWSIRLHVPVSVRECMIDYLIETTCIYICALLCFMMFSVMCLFIIMSISVERHKLWCTVRDMCLTKTVQLLLSFCRRKEYLYWFYVF